MCSGDEDRCSFHGLGYLTIMTVMMMITKIDQLNFPFGNSLTTAFNEDSLGSVGTVLDLVVCFVLTLLALSNSKRSIANWIWTKPC